MGNWCENCIPCVLLVVELCGAACAGGAAECIVVRVVVKDRTDGAGDENVLSGPRPELSPPPIVADVPAADEAACEGAASECAISVDMVGASDLFPMVGGWRSSSDTLAERLLRFKDEVLVVPAVGEVERDAWLLLVVVRFWLMWPDSG